MEFFFVILFIALIVFFFLFLKEHQDRKNYIENLTQQEKDKWLKNIQEARDNYNNEVVKLRAELNTIKMKNSAAALDLERLDKEIQLKKDFNASLLKMREDELNRQIETMRAERLTALDKEYDDAVDEYHRAIEITKQDEYKEYLDTKAILQKDIEDTKAVLEDFRARREAVNQEILRQRELEEKQDFYRVQLSDEQKSDIQILQYTKSRLAAPLNLDKIIYDVYISKPVNEMIKRVLNGEAPSGIYKITRLKTGEIYIGKSTDVKARWQQHSKTVYGTGSVSFSVLHSTMQKDGIENFTWELLEKVPKEKLSEREKYWINFYNSKSYGLNEREG